MKGNIRARKCLPILLATLGIPEVWWLTGHPKKERTDEAEAKPNPAGGAKKQPLQKALAQRQAPNRHAYSASCRARGWIALQQAKNASNADVSSPARHRRRRARDAPLRCPRGAHVMERSSTAAGVPTSRCASGFSLRAASPSMHPRGGPGPAEWPSSPLPCAGRAGE